eukprot:6211765-Pyramimonas_sp.AAC.1
MSSQHTARARQRFSRGVYTASPPTIGSHAEYILPPLLRLVLTRSICCLPSYDGFSRGVYAASPLAIGYRAGNILPPLLRLALTRSIYCLCLLYTSDAADDTPCVDL